MKKGYKRLGLLYALAAALWLAFCLFGLARAAWQGANGRYGRLEIDLGNVELRSLVELQNLPDGSDAAGWYISTDADSQLLWQAGGRYIEQVSLTMRQLRPSGAVVLYYLKPGQTDFTPRQMVYAQPQADGSYLFDLGGKTVQQLRIDPDSLGAVPVKLEHLVLEPGRPWWRRFVPGWLALAALLGLPLAAEAAWRLLAAPKGEKQEIKEGRA